MCYLHILIDTNPTIVAGIDTTPSSPLTQSYIYYCCVDSLSSLTTRGPLPNKSCMTRHTRAHGTYIRFRFSTKGES